ncbi:MAG: nucleotidyltransferase family protein [Bacteroidota bacterium]|nr:nucleotidyltransferase family protein [Bacteroidota bacterium]
MKSIQEIKDILKKEIPYLKKEYAVSYLGIFGSYIRNEQTSGSDLDLLIDFEPERYPGFKFFQLEEYLKQKLNLNIDLVPKDALRKRIGSRILSEVEEL